MTYQDGKLAIPLRRYESWVDYADARQQAFEHLERAIRAHLLDGGTIRESHNGRIVDWTINGAVGSLLMGEDVIAHIVARYLGFGTTLNLIGRGAGHLYAC